VGKAQALVARAETGLAAGAVVVGPLQAERAQHAEEDLGPASSQTGLAAAFRTGGEGPCGVAVVGVEPARDGPGRQSQNRAPQGRLYGLQVESIDLRPYECFDFREDFRGERLAEPPFSASSLEASWRFSSCASAHCSQTVQYSSRA